jgi:3-hydroxyacyl-CoA dehydrogenase
MSSMVDFQKHGAIGVLTVNNPPVNALSQGVRQGLTDGVAKGLGDPGIAALVIIGGGRTFIAGADIREFGKPMQPPGLMEVLDAMEGASKPVIAAIHGTALGGGLEVALACHWRVAVESAQVGLPEVKLGLLPGAGGTQRLPRLVGPAAALDMIVSGNPIGAKKALAMGVIDEVVSGDLLAGAIAFAERVVKEKRPLKVISRMDDKVKGVDPKIFADFRKANERKLRGFFAPWRIIETIEAACTLPFAEGMKKERDLFTQCMASPERAAQIHIFFAEREAAKIPDVPADVAPKKIAKAAIIGAGTMGGGIAMNFANAGVPVKILEVSQEALAKGLGVIEKNYATSVSRGSMPQAAMDKAMGLISSTQRYEDIGDADIVVEAAFEEMAVKKQIFATLDKVMKPGAILASNTSTLDIDEIASATKRPEAVIGTHFFSPANVMRLLENVRGKKSSKETIATVMAVGKQIKKIAVLAGNCDGFIGNRMLAGYSREASFLLEEGATPWQIDQALFDFGLPMGIFAMADLAGLDVGWRIRKGKAHLRDPKERDVSIADQLCEMGRFGQKTGAGYYKYEGRNAVPDPMVERLIEEAAKKNGIKRRQISNEEIISRCLYPLINIGAQVLDERIAIRSSDIDVTYVYGYGFPAYRGGPMFWAEQIGLAKVLDTIEKYHAEHGKNWAPAPLLVKLVKDGKKAWNER